VTGITINMEILDAYDYDERRSILTVSENVACNRIDFILAVASLTE